MSLILNYAYKKDIKVGEKLDYTETSMFGREYTDNGIVLGCNRPTLREFPKHAIRKSGREFYASITMVDGKIAKVE